MRYRLSIAGAALSVLTLILLPVTRASSQSTSIEWTRFDTLPAQVCNVIVTPGDSLYVSDVEGICWLTEDRGDSWRKVERNAIPWTYRTGSWSDADADTGSDFERAVLSKVKENLPPEAFISVRSKRTKENALVTIVVEERERVDRTKDSLVLPTVSHHTTLYRYSLWKARRFDDGRITAVCVDEDTVKPMYFCGSGLPCYDWEPGKFRVIPIGAEQFLVYEFNSALATRVSNGFQTFDALPVIDLERDTTIMIPAPGSAPRGRVVVWSSATAVYCLASDALWWFSIPFSEREERYSRDSAVDECSEQIQVLID